MRRLVTAMATTGLASTLGMVALVPVAASPGDRPGRPALSWSGTGPGVAPAPAAATCFDQTSGGVGTVITSQDFEAAFDAYDSIAADDFTLHHPCTIGSMQVAGSYFYDPSAGPARSETVTFYDESFDVITRQTVVGSDLGGSFDIPLRPFRLDAGTYWVSVVVNMDYVPDFQWGWETTHDGHGQPAIWQNPGDGHGTGCTTWGVMQECLGDIGQGSDFVFQLGQGSLDEKFVVYERPTEEYLDDMCIADPSPHGEGALVRTLEMGPGEKCVVHRASFWRPLAAGADTTTMDPLTLEVQQVPSADFPTWGQPEDVESTTPWILYTRGATSVEITFGPVGQYAGTNCKGGVEVQPREPGEHTYLGEFIDSSGEVIGTVEVVASAPAGAKLIGAAATGDPRIKSLRITDISEDVPPGDFGLAQIRDCRGGGALDRIVQVKKASKVCKAPTGGWDEFDLRVGLALSKPASSCDDLTVAFNVRDDQPQQLEVRKAGDSWAVWRKKNKKPWVLSTQSATSVLLTFGPYGSAAGTVRLAGVEIQPRAKESHDYMAEFRDVDDQLIGTMYQTAESPKRANTMIGRTEDGSASIKTVRITDISALRTPGPFAIAEVSAAW